MTILRFICAAFLAGVAASGALACEPAPYNPAWKDAPISVGPTCAFENAGETEDFPISGSAAKSLGNGHVYQVISVYGACQVSETLLVVDCEGAKALMVEGVALPGADDFGGGPDTLVENILRPKGSIKLNKRATLARIEKAAQRKGYEKTSDVAAALAGMKPQNRYAPFCGCKLHYPNSKGGSE